MLVLLNTDPYVDAREAMYEHLESVVIEALGHHGRRITRVAAYLTDANGATQGGPCNIHCTLEVRLVGHEPVLARHRAPTAGEAIHGALRKLSFVLASEFEKQDRRFASPERLSEHRPEQTSPAGAQAAA